MMFASALGVFVAVGLIIIAFISMLLGMANSFGNAPEYIPKPNTVYKLTLEGNLTDQKEENPLGFLMGEKEKSLSLKDVLSTIRTAKENKDIKGIYLDAKFLGTGTASLEAIRRALQDFKESGKFVVAYADNYTQGCYYLCSVADKVFLNPQGMLGLTGMASETMFYKGLLQKLGIEMIVFKVGTYKGAVEPFMLDKLSDANREQIQSYIDSVWGRIVNDISIARNIPVADIALFVNNGDWFATPEKTLEYGLVDKLKYRPEAEEYIKKLAGQTDRLLVSAEIGKMKTIKSTQKKKEDHIAILYAEGEIKPTATSPLYGTEPAITEKVANELIKLKNDEHVKAVVFRINSPGGSAFVSEQIWRQVVELKKVKPIVVSMGNVAASGGYYISCAANKIVAEPTTLTGSIGIFGIFPNITGLLNKIAITTDVVKTNTYSDLGDMSRPMREDEKKLIQGYVERGYDTFVTRCADGRGLSKDSINAIGQGRVWTGSQALERGLVDELGGMETAVKTAAGLANLSDYSLMYVTSSKDYLKELLEKQFGEMKWSLVKDILGEEYTYFERLNQIKTATGIQARLPYDVKPL